MKYVVLTTKIIFIIVFFPFAGNFVVNKLLNLGIEWAYGIFLILSILLAVEIVGRTFSYSNVWSSVEGTTRKFIIISSLVVFLSIISFPASQGIQNRWIKFLCTLVALTSFIPLFLFERRFSGKQEKNQ